MNLRIAKSWEWSSGIVLDGGYVINDYQATVEMQAPSDNEAEHLRALERQRWWIGDVMQDAVVMAYDDRLVNLYQQTGQRVIALPYPPFDHTLLVMLYCKLNAIMEQRLVISQIYLSSQQGQGVVYSHQAEDDLFDFVLDGWWCESHPVWANSSPRADQESVIALERMPDWHDLGLAWPNHPDSSEIVDFRNGKK
jgi:hypothetical protein